MPGMQHPQPNHHQHAVAYPPTYHPGMPVAYAPTHPALVAQQQQQPTPQYPPAGPPQTGPTGPAHPHIPQQDGSGDTPADDKAGASGGASGGGGDVKEGKAAAGGGKGGEQEEEEEEVDTLDDVKLSEDEDDGEDIEDFVLCTFEKVHRTKAKWKSALKNGIAHIDGRDYVFNRCNGEMRFH